MADDIFKTKIVARNKAPLLFVYDTCRFSPCVALMVSFVVYKV